MPLQAHPSRRWLLVVAVLLLGAAGILRTLGKTERHAAVSPSEPGPALPAPAASSLSTVPQAAPRAPASAPATAPQPAPRGVQSRDPDSLPEDPFESQRGEEPAIRTLLAVGDIQLGVTRGSRIRDEPGLTRALGRIGSELEERSAAAPSQGVGALQQILDGYSRELGQYMDGEIELRGPSWMIGVEVGTPPALGEGWRPRPR